jgi:alkyl hydroperoxide reductase subunit AhpC
LADFERESEELATLGAKVYAASVDDVDKASESASNLSYPMAHGITRADADKIGAWWEDRRGIIQPSEFIVGADGKVVSSTYSSGPVGRLLATDAVKIINMYESRK